MEKISGPYVKKYTWFSACNILIICAKCSCQNNGRCIDNFGATGLISGEGQFEGSQFKSGVKFVQIFFLGDCGGAHELKISFSVGGEQQIFVSDTQTDRHICLKQRNFSRSIETF